MQKHLIERLITRLRYSPEVLDTSEFSRRTVHGTTYCLGGLILAESDVRMRYDVHGHAVDLAPGEPGPSQRWREYELTIVENVTMAEVSIPAKAREIWASVCDDYAAEILPLYARDWDEGMSYHDVTAETVIEYLRGVQLGLHRPTGWTREDTTMWDHHNYFATVGKARAQARVA